MHDTAGNRIDNGIVYHVTEVGFTEEIELDAFKFRVENKNTVMAGYQYLIEHCNNFYTADKIVLSKLKYSCMSY